MALYTEFRKRTQWRAKHLSDVVPWRMVAAPGVVLHKEQHALMRTYTVRGVDSRSEARETQGMRMMQANNVLKRLGGRWLLQAEAQRRRVQALPQATWASPVGGLLGEEWDRVLLEHIGLRETSYYFTLTWFPPPPATIHASRLAVRGPVAAPAAQNGHQAPLLQTFVEEADGLMDLLRGVLAVCQPLTTAELLTYLHTTVSDTWHPIGPPGVLTDIDMQLCDRSWKGGWYPMLGDWHVRSCSITAYPAMSFVTTMYALDGMDLDYRWCTRWQGLEKHTQAGILRQTQGAWVHHERGLLARLSESVSKEPTRILNTDATNKAREADAARQEIGADLVAYGQFSGTVTVWDTDAQRAEDKRRAVMQVLNANGIGTRAETEHATAVWLSTHPGNRVDNVRKTAQHSLTLAHLCPGLQAIWPGPEHDDFLQGPPWFIVPTVTNTLFRVVNHVNDLGHYLCLGPTRSGKSVLCAFMVAQWLKYLGAQVFWFDVDRSARCLTLLLGGHWYDLAGGSLAFQPLRGIDDMQEQGWALHWLLDLVRDAQTPITGEVQAYLASGLRKLAIQPPSRRTISTLLTIMAEQTRQTDLNARSGRTDAAGMARPDARLEALVAAHHMVRMALKPYTREGEYGWLLDADHDDLQEGPLHTFEQRALLTMPRLVGPVTRYIFHRLEQRFSTAHPTLAAMDEAALTWAIPDYETKGKEWMMTTAKKAVSLGFFTHSLSQVFSSALGPLLLESCPTRFFLPNPAARAPQMAAIYAQLGLTPEEITWVATARPQRDVYFSNELVGKRSFSLPLSPLLLACMARNTTKDHEVMDTLLQREGREGFAAAWLAQSGWTEAAARLVQGKEAQQ